MPTPLRRLADTLLEEPVEQWIQRNRDEGKSWRRISLELRDVAQIDVAPSTLISWAESDRASA